MKKIALILTVLLIATLSIGALAEAASTLPTPVAAQSKEDFIGEWQLSGMGLNGMFFSAEQIELTATLSINESTMMISFDADYGNSPWDLLEDGTLQYVDPDGTTGIFVLNDDGSVATTTDTDVGGTVYAVTLYFVRVPEA